MTVVLCGPNKPTVCSVCLQPPMVNHEAEFIDFNAAYDGPVIEDPNSTVKVHVDNIVICEGCVKEAASLIGLENGDTLKVELAEKVSEIERLRKEVAAKDKAISDLTYTVGTMMDHPVKRTAGAPTLRGPEDKEAEIKEYRKRRAKAAKVSKGKRKAKA